MPGNMSQCNSNEEGAFQTVGALEEEVELAPRKLASTGARLWDRVRSSLLRPKVNIQGASQWTC